MVSFLLSDFDLDAVTMSPWRRWVRGVTDVDSMHKGHDLWLRMPKQRAETKVPWRNSRGGGGTKVRCPRLTLHG
jgi:hypothetical protein